MDENAAGVHATPRWQQSKLQFEAKPGNTLHYVEQSTRILTINNC